ncbi:MAG: hypothetical protein ACTHLO_08560 [Pseudolabrys sp.]
MKTIILRAAFAALLATTAGVGFAQAQVSPGDPNYQYEGRGRIAPFGAASAYASAPAVHGYSRAALNARASVVDDGQTLGQDPDANVRLQLRKSDGIFDR